MASDDRLKELEEKYEDYKVYDNQGDKIGKVDDLFIDEADREEYIGVKMGLFGMRSTLIPMEIVRVNETERTIEVSESKDHVKDAPNFDDDDDITMEYEERIRSHFSLEPSGSAPRVNYGASSASSATVEETRDREETGIAARPEAGSDASEHRNDEHTTPESDWPAGGRAEDGEASSAGRFGAAEPRDDVISQSSGSEGSTLDEGEGQERLIRRQTEETETFEESGRPKIRRRIVREEVEDADEVPPAADNPPT